MIRRRRNCAGGVLATVAVLFVAACGGTDGSGSLREEPVGDPVSGGHGRILIVSEPRSLDPAAMANSSASSGVLGNSLYGTLMTNDVVTGEVRYQMAESFTTTDGGVTFDMTLRPGLMFSDGTPLDSTAVKYNWDRIKDPETGSLSIRDAGLISSTEVIDSRTLRIALRSQVPMFAQTVLASGLNWIAEPKALAMGQQEFDRNPVGAGPFVLESWARQDKLEMVRNPTYWDAPRPYLEAVTFRSIADTTQRMNTLTSGAADVAPFSTGSSVAQMRDSGMRIDPVPQGGGQAFFMNMRRAPFDDIRARQAIAAAIDLESINMAVFEGEGEVPKTLFVEGTPFHEDINLVDTDPGLAQELFDELAAEGRPVDFTFTAYSTKEGSEVAEAVQAGLSAYENVTMKIKTVEVSEVPALYATNDYDMVISSAQIIDPEPQLWTTFHGDSTANRAGIDDVELNSALDAGRLAQDQQGRQAAYHDVQMRLVELVPAVFYMRTSFASASAQNVYGAAHYGFASMLPDRIWIQK